jgi:eukaryotic-like serine/threonine-protein kinase
MMDIGHIGKFQILGTLGKGAHSTILHIHRSADGKQYALKVVPLESKDDYKYLEQAQHEVKVARMLGHPNILKVHTLETPRDWLLRVKKAHVLLEYIKGKTLDTVKGLTIPRLVQVYAKIAAGLVHMHRRGVCHADLKPGNLMLSKTGEVKIIDFGLATIQGEGKNRIQGTPEYIAPEQVKHRMVNERTDIYNFGATMYRMVTFRLPPTTAAAEGGLPIDAKTWTRMLKPVHECNPQAPPVLCKLIHHCLSFNAADRPERMSEVQSVLDRLADQLITSPEDRLEALEW